MKIKVPTTITEAYEELDKFFAEDPQAKEEFVNLIHAEDVIQYHHGVGRWLRNNWELWSGGALAQYLTGLGVQDPDEMSHRLLEGYWSYCHGIEYDFSLQEDDSFQDDFVAEPQLLHL